MCTYFYACQQELKYVIFLKMFEPELAKLVCGEACLCTHDIANEAAISTFEAKSIPCHKYKQHTNAVLQRQSLS
jgi:hypothetical protein